jgi:hypothetical protein
LVLLTLTGGSPMTITFGLDIDLPLAFGNAAASGASAFKQ